MKTFRIFISSPGDVAEERDKAKQVIAELQRRYDGQAILIPVLWEDLPITATSPFQVGIEDQIIKSIKIDIAVFILWSKLGSPTGPSITKSDGTAYLSGTEREFDLMLHAFEQSGGKSPLIFAYTRRDDESFGLRLDAAKQDDDALEELIKQRRLVKRFINERFQDKDGHNLRAYHSYNEPVAFAQRLQVHLSGAIDGLLGLDSDTLSRSLEKPPQPDNGGGKPNESVTSAKAEPYSRDALLPVTNSKEITVSLEGSANFRTISEALERVSDGGIVRIREGHYQEAIVIKRPVTLFGEGCEKVTVQAIGVRVISVVNAIVVFRGITFHGIKPGDDSNQDEDVCLKSAVCCEQSSISADACRFICDGGHSLALRGTSTAATIRSCQFQDDNGCYLAGSVSATFEKCAFSSKWTALVGAENSSSRLVDSNIASDMARFFDSAQCHLVRCKANFGKYCGVTCTDHAVIKFDASEINAVGRVLGLDDSASGFIVNSSLVGGEGSAVISISGTARTEITDTAIVSCSDHTVVFCRESSRFQMMRGSIKGERAFSVCDTSVAKCKVVQFTGSGKHTVGFSPSDKADARLENCVFRGFKNGALISGSGTTRIMSCAFIGDGEKYSNGISISEDNHAIVEGCEISGYGGKGVSISDNSECKIRGCRIHRNDVGISSSSTGKPTISDCDLRDNRRGAFMIDEGCRVRDFDNRK